MQLDGGGEATRANRQSRGAGLAEVAELRQKVRCEEARIAENARDLPRGRGEGNSREAFAVHLTRLGMQCMRCFPRQSEIAAAQWAQ